MNCRISKRSSGKITCKLGRNHLLGDKNVGSRACVMGGRTEEMVDEAPIPAIRPKHGVLPVMLPVKKGSYTGSG